jgi:DNA-binding CsgD family transcriptional regulator
VEAIELMGAVVRLSEQRCWSGYVVAVGHELDRLVPADRVFWVETDPAAGTASVWDAARGTADDGLGALLTRTVRHPRVREYAATRTGVRPHRLSDHDICADVRTEEHRVLLREMGAYQLNLPVGPHAGTWILGRAERDFTDAELVDAAWLAPTLAALHGRFRPLLDEGPGPTGDVALEAAGKVVAAALSPREVDILALVAQGLTADSIARRRRISPRTVRKHLEHIYAKLGRHDRLTAVAHAASLGLIDAG